MGVELSVVVPVYRNAATLRELHTRITKCVSSGWSYEVIYVNDACPESSLDVLLELGKFDPHVVLVNQGQTVGQNRAVISGLGVARGATAVVLDADLQDPPEAIAVLVSELRRGHVAAVFAARRGKYESTSRLATARMFRWVLRRLPGSRLPEGAGLFVAMDHRLIAFLSRTTQAKPYVVGLIGRAGFSLGAVPVERLPNVLGQSSYGAWQRLKLGVNALTAGLRVSRR